MGIFGDFKDVVRLLTEVLGMFRRLAVQDGRQDGDGGKVLPSSEKRRIAAGVQAFFEKNYDLRYNVMKQTVLLTGCSDDGEGDAADLLVDIEGIDIGHATDIIDDGHDARFEVGGIDVVLTRHTTD